NFDRGEHALDHPVFLLQRLGGRFEIMEFVSLASGRMAGGGMVLVQFGFFHVDLLFRCFRDSETPVTPTPTGVFPPRSPAACPTAAHGWSPRRPPESVHRNSRTRAPRVCGSRP